MTVNEALAALHAELVADDVPDALSRPFTLAAARRGQLVTAAALLEAAGLASWAYTVGREDFTLEDFRTVAPVTKDNRAKAASRRAPGRQPDDSAPAA